VSGRPSDAGDRDTYRPFTPEEVVQIRQQVVTKPQPACPRCQTPLTSRPALGGTMATVILIKCDACRRTAVL